MFKGHGVGVAFGEGYVTVDCRGVYVYGCSEEPSKVTVPSSAQVAPAGR